MNGHFANMCTDGTRIYLTDVGPATSPRFDLTAAERDFAQRNATHDAGYAALQLVNWPTRGRPAAIGGHPNSSAGAASGEYGGDSPLAAWVFTL